MKSLKPRVMPALLALVVALPASAQNTAQLKQDNERLKAQLQALQLRCNPPAQSGGVQWNQGALDARIDAFRIGSPHPKRTEITVTLRLRNTGPAPIILNYQGGSWAATDNNGYQYETHGTVKGVPVATPSRADTSALIDAGGSRTVTFNARRGMRDGQTPGDRFDINVTFVQLEDLGQGRIRRVRDYPVAFTNVAVTGRDAAGIAPATQIDEAASQLLKRLTK